jgi:hypothetical protein
MPQKSTLTPRICEYCGKEFEVPARIVRSGGGKYCSLQCHGMNVRKSLADALWDKVEKTEDCWLWQGSLNRGYGHMSRGEATGKSIGAHRVAWELVAGAIPDGLFVCHTCDNRACVRNDDEGWYEVNGILHPRRGHLWIGTQADNMADMIAKGREPDFFAGGEAHHNAKLSAAAVREIRERYADGNTTYQVLADRFGVKVGAVGKVVRGERRIKA